VTPFGPFSLQAELAKPMTHRRLAQANHLGYLSARHSGPNQRLQVLPAQASTGNVLVAVHRPKPVFLDPVPNRGFVQIDAPTDLRE
jgi:hypothetical protein